MDDAADPPSSQWVERIIRATRTMADPGSRRVADHGVVMGSGVRVRRRCFICGRQVTVERECVAIQIMEAELARSPGHVAQASGRAFDATSLQLVEKRVRVRTK